MTAWLTTTEAAALIGAGTEPDQTYLNQAAAIVEAFINREVEDIPNISARDLRRIQKAMAWQAFYLFDQPDFNYLSIVEGVSTDGQSFQMAKRGTDGSVFEAAQVLHPLAIRELRNLSWKRTHMTLSAPSSAQYSFLNEAFDDDHSWRELS
jgi:hypothetical protein